MTEKPKKPAADTPAIHLDLSDPDLKKRVLACIEKNSHLKVFLHPQGEVVPQDGGAPYRRID